VWCIVRGHNLFHNPYVGRMAIYFYDDSLRRFAVEALNESERKFSNLIQNLHLGVMLLSPDGEILACNTTLLATIGMRQEQMIGRNLSKFDWHIKRDDGSDFPEEERPVRRALVTKKPVTDQVMGIQKPGTEDWVWVMTNVKPLLDEKGNVDTILCSYTDITEQRKIAKESIEQEIQKQKLITQATIDGQEKERLQIGKELHDNISQHLTMTRLYLEVVRDKAEGNLLEMVSHAHRNLSDIINEIRVLSQSLVPPTLGDLGLIESVHDLCGALQRTQAFQVEFQHRHFNEDYLPENMKLMLFRIIQEQVNNIVKHSRASKVIVKLQSDAEQVSLTVSDNGIGFDPENRKRGLGLTGISNRASLFNAQTQIESSPGKGCSLNVTVPFSRNPEEE